MSAQPSVELTFEPSELSGLQQTGRLLGTPAEAMTAALNSARTQMMSELKERLDRPGLVTAGTVATATDASWELVRPSWVRLSVPVLAEAYLKAYRKADAGDISRDAVYALARRHAVQLGDYYNETSKEAMIDGFSGYVNRKVAARAAANQVAEAYGLTPRQMRAYVAARMQWQRNISSFTPMGLKREAAKFIVKSLWQRYKTISEQELHNVGEEGKQLAWMYLLEKGDLPAHAEKMWLTAKDERVCKICGPLHGTRIPITEKFQTKEGEFWSPGLHPNCRCELRLLPHEFRDVNDVQKDLRGGEVYEFNRQHPRGPGGRWRAKTEVATALADPDEEFLRIIQGQRQLPVATAVSRATATERDKKLEQQFNAIIRSATKRPPQSRIAGVVAPTAPKAVSQTELLRRVEAARVEAQAQAQAAMPKAKVARPKSQVARAKTKATTSLPKSQVATKTKAKASAPTRARTSTATSTGVHAPEKLKQPLYGAVPLALFEGDDTSIELTSRTSLTKDRDLAVHQAAASRKDAINRTVRSITRRVQPNEIAGIPPYGQGWELKKHFGKSRVRPQFKEGEPIYQYWDMTESQVQELVEWVAQQAVSETLNADYRHQKNPRTAEEREAINPEEPEFTSVWRDADGKQVGHETTYTARNLMEHFNLSPKHYDWRVVEVNEALHEHPKDTEYNPPETEKGPTVDGMYEVERGSVNILESERLHDHVAWMRLKPKKSD